MYKILKNTYNKNGVHTILVPTKGGMNKQLFKQLSKYGDDDLNVILCIEDTEADNYKDTKYTVITIPTSVHSTYTCPVVLQRNALLTFAHKNHLGNAFMIDDDVRLNTIIEDDSMKAGYGRRTINIRTILDTYIETIPEDTGLGGVYQPMDAYGYLRKGIKYAPLKTLSHFYYMNFNYNRELFTDTFAEDYDYMLKCINSGIKTYMCHTVAKDAEPMGNNIIRYEDLGAFYSPVHEELYEKYKDTRVGKYISLKTSNVTKAKQLKVDSKYMEELNAR